MYYIVLSVIILAVTFLAYSFSDLIFRRAMGFKGEVIPRRRNKMVVVIGLAIFIIFTLARSLTMIPAGEIGVVYRFGAIVGQLEEGLRIKLPTDDIVLTSIQVQKIELEKLECFSSETQNVYIDTTVLFSVSPQSIQKLFREVGKNYANILIIPRVYQNLKDTTVSYKSVDIAPHREEIRKKVQTLLDSELTPHSITIQDFLISNITFDPAFQQAIEDKQTATQNALKEQETIKIVQAQAQQKIEEAKGEGEAILQKALKQAEANQELSKSLTENLIQYSLVDKLGDQIKVIVVPAGQNFLFDLNSLTGTTSDGGR